MRIVLTTLRAFAVAALALLPAQILRATDQESPSLARSRYRSGQAVLNAFAPISAQASNSIVELDVNEDTVAMGAVVGSNGLVLTKASELKAGKLTCWLPSGKEVPAHLLATDHDTDVALVRVDASGLKPIQWDTRSVAEGQWVVTQGLASTPQAVGIISARTRRIRPQRAYVGLSFHKDFEQPVVEELMGGFGAEKAGVRPGDVVVAVDGSAVTNKAELLAILLEFHEGQTVSMRFERDKKPFDASIELMLLKPGERVTHGVGEGERDSRLNGNVSARSEGFTEALEHDTVLQPWQCGGPLLNLDGKAIGLNIARASRYASYALPASLAQQLVGQLTHQIETSGAANNDR